MISSATVKNFQDLRILAKIFLKNNKYAPQTQHIYGIQLERFFRRCPHDLSLITIEHIEAEVMRYSRKVMANSTNLYISAIASFFKWLKRFGHSDLDVNLYLVPCFRREQRILSRSEYESVVAFSSGYMRDIFIVLCNTGLRASEFLYLTHQNIGEEFIRIVGKGRKNRSIPINDTLRAVLTKDPKLSFLSGHSRPWLGWICNNLAAIADIKPFHPHSCRHYFATELYDRGVSIEKISLLLGHANSVITETIYIHFKEKGLFGVTDILDK